MRNRIQRRLDRLEDGNFGDSKSVGEGVFELRFHFGAGYRIYFAEVKNTIVQLTTSNEPLETSTKQVSESQPA